MRVTAGCGEQPPASFLLLVLTACIRRYGFSHASLSPSRPVCVCTYIHISFFRRASVMTCRANAYPRFFRSPPAPLSPPMYTLSFLYVARSLASLVPSFSQSLFRPLPTPLCFCLNLSLAVFVDVYVSWRRARVPSVPGVFLGASRCLSQAGDPLAERAKNVATRTRLFPSLRSPSFSSPVSVRLCLSLSTSLIHGRFRYRQSHFLGAKGCTEHFEAFQSAQ